MDYREYKAVMEDSKLEESILVKFFLNEAARCQKYIKTLKNHDSPDAVIEKQRRRKEEFIWQAIFTALDEKEQGWRYVEDGEKVKPMLLQQIEDIKQSEALRRYAVGN